MNVSASLQQGMHLLKVAVDKGLDHDQLRQRFDSGILADILDPRVEPAKFSNPTVRDAVRQALGLPPLCPQPAVSPPYAVTVDYSQSLENMVEAGEYDVVSKEITAQNFPVSGTGTVEEELFLVHFGRLIKSEDAITEMAQMEMGLEPAPIEYSLAFGAKYPDVQRKFPIVCLRSSGVSPYGDRLFPALDSWDRKRKLILVWFEYDWLDPCRFLARRKRQ